MTASLRLARHSFVLARRSLVGVRRTPEQLIDVTLQPIIFIALFTYIFGGAIANGSQHDYLQFMLPGVLAQTIAFGSVAIGVNLNTDLEKGIFDRFRSLPIARSAPLVGAVLADVVRYGVLSVVTVGAGLAFGFDPHGGVVGVLAACALGIAFALCLSWASVWVGMLARSSGSVQGILFLLMFPLTFAAGTFVPVDTLPGWLQSFVDVNPFNHLTSAMRALMQGTAAGSHVLWTLAWMGVFLVVFVPLALRAYGRRTA